MGLQQPWNPKAWSRDVDTLDMDLMKWHHVPEAEVDGLLEAGAAGEQAALDVGRDLYEQLRAADRKRWTKPRILRTFAEVGYEGEGAPSVGMLGRMLVAVRTAEVAATAAAALREHSEPYGSENEDAGETGGEE